MLLIWKTYKMYSGSLKDRKRLGARRTSPTWKITRKGSGGRPTLKKRKFSLGKPANIYKKKGNS